MKINWKDFVKTLGAIVIIGGIIAATFLYGNQQRQKQLQTNNQPVTNQAGQGAGGNNQNNKSGGNVSVGNGSSTNPQSTGQAPQSTGQTPQTTGGSNLQGGTQPGQGSAGTTATAPTRTPDTGGELFFMIPLGAIVVLYHVNRNSRKSIREAAISRF